TGNATTGDAEFSLSTNSSSGDNWDGSTLIIGRDDGAGGISEDANDQLAAKSGSSLSLSNGALRWSNTEVGTYTNSGGKLSITFNSDANTSAVQGVLRNLTYSHAITTPGALNEDNVTLRLIFNDQNSNTSTAGLDGSSNGAGSGQDQGSGGESITSSTINIKINRLPIATANTNSLSEGLNTDDVSTTTGNVLTDATNENDPDLDAVNSGNASLGPDGTPRTDSLSITGVVHEAVANTFIVSSTGANSDVVGSYGSVNIATDGSYTYTLDNTNGTVQALATAEELTDTFTFTVSDGNGGFTSNTLTITIIGTNDYPEISMATGGIETYWWYQNSYSSSDYVDANAEKQ
ncbi:MAG: hypothetical protein EBU42_11750, partial [Synechococcus sp.]|nr:hypothetical protein [Synechococcus sp.]